MTLIPELLFKSRQTALIAAHPPHLMQVYGWIEKIKPRVSLLTDGSGRDGISRMAPADLFLENVHAPCGVVYGRFTDQEIYSKILNQDVRFFIEQAEEITRDLIRHGTQFVFGDPAEGFNPIHDICRLLTGAAIKRVRRETGLKIANFDFSLEKDPDNCPEDLRDQALWLTLSDDEVRKKISFTQFHYPEMFTIEHKSLDPDRHRTECLRPCTDRAGFDGTPEDPPFYERHGEERAASGRYKDVIRYREHVRPIGEALWEFACKKVGAAV